MYLPSGYTLDETDPAAIVLRRPDGSEVAVYSAAGADSKEMERQAWEDFRVRGSRGMPSRVAILALAAMALALGVMIYEARGLLGL